MLLFSKKAKEFVDTKKGIEVLKEEIEDRECTLSELQLLLENVADKYSKTIEKQRYRTETNQDVEIQVSASLKDVSQQVNFSQNLGHATMMRAENMKVRQGIKKNAPITNSIIFE